MPRLRSALAVSLAALLALAPAGLAHAEGSVPSEVRAYVADGSLVRQLNDVYGVGAAGDGIDFDDTTTTGAIERVHAWSAALRDGEETEHLVDILNEWVVPVSIAEEPVGLATIWINPDTVRPELASFVADPELATALSAVPDGASLVHDAESSAWLALAPDGILTALVPGSTGLSTPVPIDDVAILPATEPAPESTGDPGTGVGLALAVLLVLFAIIVVALVVPVVRGRRAKGGDAETAVAGEPGPVGVEAAAPRKALEAAPVTDPSGKPAGATGKKTRTTTEAAATTKPPAAKEPAAGTAKKPAAKKPATATAKKPATGTAKKAPKEPAAKASETPTSGSADD